ncbi:MAG: response regulator [Hyphomicrobiales bacterium]|nr:MAG: response regulator [Hyphomicrobiales bacterium]
MSCGHYWQVAPGRFRDPAQVVDFSSPAGFCWRQRMGATMVSFAGRTVLVVDDEFLIASMIEDIFARQGAEVLVATRTDEAAAHLADHHVDFAMIDYQMRATPSEEIWTELQARHIPFAFCTGSFAAEMHDRFPGITIVPKPFSEDLILDAARALVG